MAKPSRNLLFHRLLWVKYYLNVSVLSTTNLFFARSKMRRGPHEASEGIHSGYGGKGKKLRVSKEEIRLDFSFLL